MKNGKNQKPRRQYDTEFKKNALQLIADGRTVSSVAQSLGVSEGLLYNWKSKAKKAVLTKPQSEEKAEIARLKKELVLTFITKQSFFTGNSSLKSAINSYLATTDFG